MGEQQVSATLQQVLVADPCGRVNVRLVAAAGRAGGVGIVDVADPADLPMVAAELGRRRVEAWWLRPGPAVTAAAVAGTDLRPAAVVLPGDGVDAATVDGWGAVADRVVAQCVSPAEAEAARQAGVSGLVASGAEAGGRVGDTEAFILFQQLVELGLAVWVRGGIGRHTAAAVVAGGGAGVLLDAQLGCCKEADLQPATRQLVAAMDGSETRVVGGHRFLTRPDLPAAALPDDTGVDEVASFLGVDLRTQLVPIGQDGGFAAGLAERYATVGGVVQAVAAAIEANAAAAAEAEPLAPGHGVSEANGTRYPIAQGPMTRVSDRAAFARSVADGGG
ncbi:MAG: hypothetical protein KDA97_14975, partial [Acidimicrobiales bacterium]|nr:hypothetical protein [Acidimicrobiales bacterium]